MSASPDRGRAPGREPLASATTLALGLFGLSLPYSTAGISVALGAMLVLAMLRWREFVAVAPWRVPVMAVGLGLMGFIAMHTLVLSGWTDASRGAINHYHELLVAPLAFGLMRQPATRRVFYRCFIAGCTLVALAMWVGRMFTDQPVLQDILVAHRISAGFALATAAFLLVVRAPRRPSSAHLLAAGLVATVFVAMDGRTGQLVVLLYASCIGWQLAPRRWRWAAALGLPLALAALALASPGVQGRADEVRAAWHRGRAPDPNDSTGIRIELIRITSHLARQHPWTGVGFANYGTAHEAAAHEVYAAMPGGAQFQDGPWTHIHNPHDEFLLQLIGGGVVALVLYIAWLGAALAASRRAPGPAGTALAGLALAFAFGCLVNSWLYDFIEAHVYVGLLAFLLAEVLHPPAQDEFGRVLVVATRQIGDVLLTTPLLRAARRRWPQARIGVLGFTGTLGMLRGNPDIDQLIELPPGRSWRTLALVARLWRRWDLALVTDPGDRAHLAGTIAAPLRAGIVPAEGGTMRLKRALLAHAVVSADDLGERHTVVEKQALLAPWQPPGAGLQALVPPPARPLPPDLAEQLQPGAVVVHAPSMWAYKQWPPAHWAALVQGLLAQGRQVVLTGSASARDQAVVAPLRTLGSSPTLLDASGRLDFNQLVTLMQRCDLFIGPDTSISHLAAAVGIRQLAIFGPTNPQRWAPWTGRPIHRHALSQPLGPLVLLQGSLACVPCGRAGCENRRDSRADCLPDIRPERVLDEAMRLLA